MNASVFMPISKSLPDLAYSTIKIEASEPASGYFGWKNGSIDHRSLPGICPPANDFVIEVSSFQSGIDFAKHYGEDIRSYAVHYHAQRVVDSSDWTRCVKSIPGHWSLQSLHWDCQPGWFLKEALYIRTNISILPFGTRCSKITEDGSGQGDMPGRIPELDVASETSRKMAEGLISLFLTSTRFVLSFLGCKNVDLRESEHNYVERVPREKNPGKTRAREAILRYHVLQITKPKSRADSAVSDPVTEDLTALHVCRGHFKHYTPERPLLGRHTGTYYFSQHWRGSKENGVVLKDYEVVSS